MQLCRASSRTCSGRSIHGWRGYFCHARYPRCYFNVSPHTVIIQRATEGTELLQSVASTTRSNKTLEMPKGCTWGKQSHLGPWGMGRRRAGRAHRGAEWHPRMLLGQGGQGDVVPMRSPSAGRCLLERLWNKINIMHLLAVYRGPRDSAPVDFLHRHILLGKQDAQASGVMAGRKGWW